MRSFCWSDSPISLKARVSSPTSSPEVGGTRTARSPFERRSTPTRSRRSGPTSSATKAMPHATPRSVTATARAESWRCVSATIGSTSTSRSSSTCASPIGVPLKATGAATTRREPRRRAAAGPSGSAPVSRSYTCSRSAASRDAETLPSMPTRRAATRPRSEPACWISAPRRSVSLASSGSLASLARFSASALPWRTAAASRARRSCCVATQASATQAITRMATTRALNLT